MQAPQTLFLEMSSPLPTCCGLTLETPSIEVRPRLHTCHPAWVWYTARSVVRVRQTQETCQFYYSIPQIRAVFYSLWCKM